MGLARSSLYYFPSRDTSYNEQLMMLIDKQYMRTPFYGVDKMTAWLQRQGHGVNPKRVRRLMRLMALEAVYPRRKRGLSIPDKEHKIYPYLLRDVAITRPDQVWSTDITYIRMYRGWLYLMAIMDWFSRYVIAWELSVTLEADFCVKGLERALATGRPEIFNTDQGSQFTSADFLEPLKATGVQISMDGQGRVFDNIFVERLRRTVKVEEVYLRYYQTVSEARSRRYCQKLWMTGAKARRILGACSSTKFQQGKDTPHATEYYNGYGFDNGFFRPGGQGRPDRDSPTWSPADVGHSNRE